MRFLYLDTRTQGADRLEDHVLIFANSFEMPGYYSNQDYYEEGALPGRYNIHAQADLSHFANQWLKNIKQQGFLKSTALTWSNDFKA